MRALLHSRHASSRVQNAVPFPADQLRLRVVAAELPDAVRGWQPGAWNREVLKCAVGADSGLLGRAAPTRGRHGGASGQQPADAACADRSGGGRCCLRHRLCMARPYSTGPDCRGCRPVPVHCLAAS